MKILKKIGSRNFKQYTTDVLLNDHFLVTMITKLIFIIILSILNFLTLTFNKYTILIKKRSDNNLNFNLFKN